MAQDLTRDVLRIDAIPSTSLDGVKEWLGSMDIKFYESKVTPPVYPCRAAHTLPSKPEAEPLDHSSFLRVQYR